MYAHGFGNITINREPIQIDYDGIYYGSQVEFEYKYQVLFPPLGKDLKKEMGGATKWTTWTEKSEKQWLADNSHKYKGVSIISIQKREKPNNPYKRKR
jgi:hypothetical protein